MIQEIQSKPWGEIQCIYVGAYSEVHFLKIVKGGCCSKHNHAHKWNRFFVIDGKLEVTIYQDGNPHDKIILDPGTSVDIPPGIFHKFQCIEGCLCNEIYWVNTLDQRDIFRE